MNRIAIEVDGMEWHKDVNKDLRREAKIHALGWRIFRIKGWMTFKNKDDFMDEEGNLSDKYYTECSEGILIDIYRNKVSPEHEKRMYMWVSMNGICP